MDSRVIVFVFSSLGVVSLGWGLVRLMSALYEYGCAQREHIEKERYEAHCRKALAEIAEHGYSRCDRADIITFSDGSRLTPIVIFHKGVR